jgi:hypothetical protein
MSARQLNVTPRQAKTPIGIRNPELAYYQNGIAKLAENKKQKK